MSDAIKRTTSITVRLSVDEKAQLEQAAAQRGVDKSVLVRRALRELAQPISALSLTGVFTPLHAAHLTLPIHFCEEDADAR